MCLGFSGAVYGELMGRAGRIFSVTKSAEVRRQEPFLLKAMFFICR